MERPLGGQFRALQISGLVVAVGVLLLLVAAPVAGATPLPAKNKAIAHCSVEVGPEFPAYDPADKETYVPNRNNATISVIEGTCTVVATIALPQGAGPIQAAYDPQNSTVYVTAEYEDLVYGIVGSTIVSTWNTSADALNYPWGIIYDPTLGSNLYASSPGGMVISNLGNDTISGVTTFHGFFGAVPAQGSYALMAYGAADNDVVLAEEGPSQVAVFGASQLNFDHTALTGMEPAAVAYDPSSSEFYVANYASQNISILSSTGYLIGNISSSAFNFPYGIAYSPASKLIYVADGGSHDVVLLKGTKVYKVVKTPCYDPTGLSYDSSNHDIYATGFQNALVCVISK
jgi:DNA-binding beta-propeller fold protein YncE